MSRAALGLFLGSLVLVGCSTPLISRAEFQRAVASHAHETICIFRYMGSRDNLHYFRLSTTYGSRTYRVPAADWRLAESFPLTVDETRWRFVDDRGEFLVRAPEAMYFVPQEFLR